MLRKDNCKRIWETLEFWDLLRLVLEILRYVGFHSHVISFNKWTYTRSFGVTRSIVSQILTIDNP